MHNLTNLPTAKSKVPIVGRVEGENIRICHEDGLEICTLHGQSKEVLAREIASAIGLARDRGFEQGLASVRAALGFQV